MTNHTTQFETVRRRLRAEMPVAERSAYLDHAAMSALTRPAADALQSWLQEAVEIGNPVWPDWVKRVEAMRADAARLIGAQPDEIALVTNTTAGISLVAEGFHWRAGDNVVTLADEFPSNVYPWFNLESRGVETRRVPTDVSGRLDLERLAEACNERTRIVTVSWIGFATGYRHDLREIASIAHQRGAFLFVDAIQGLGAFPLDVNDLGIDFLAADGHKWMLGPEGAGIAYIRREHLDRLRPLGVGWHSVPKGQDYTHIELNLRPTAARYEGGSQNNAGMIALGASLKLLMELGIDFDRRFDPGYHRPRLRAADGNWCQNRFRPPSGAPRRRTTIGHRFVRAARPRPAGRKTARLAAKRSVWLPCRPVAYQPPCVQQ